MGCPGQGEGWPLWSTNSIVRLKPNLAPLILCLVLTACSARDFLSRRLATDLILASSALKNPQPFLLRIGVLTGNGYPSPEYLVLQNHGWISANTVPCPAGLTPSPCWNIVLSPAGVEMIRSVIPAEGARSSMSFPVARRELIAVTGITRQGIAADVEFDWKWQPLNEIGEALYSRDLRYKSVVAFRKYDDGWRLLETTLRSGQSMDEALKNAELIP